MSLGDTDGLHRAFAHHRPPSRKECRHLSEDFDPGHSVGISYEYDDGNGLWISSKETPIYLGFFRKYHPQD